MKHLLPPFRALLSESWLLAKPRLEETLKVVGLYVILPLALLAVTFGVIRQADAVTVSIMVAEALAVVAFGLMSFARLTEGALAAVDGRERNSDAPGGAMMLGALLLTELANLAAALPFQILLSVTDFMLFSILATLVSIIVSVRLDLTPTALMAEGRVVNSLRQSWRLTKGVAIRYFAFQLILALPALFLGTVLFLVLLAPTASQGDVWNEGVGPNRLQVVSVMIIAALPFILVRLCYLTFFDAVIYASLRDQEREEAGVANEVALT